MYAYYLIGLFKNISYTAISSIWSSTPYLLLINIQIWWLNIIPIVAIFFLVVYYQITCYFSLSVQVVNHWAILHDAKRVVGFFGFVGHFGVSFRSASWMALDSRGFFRTGGQVIMSLWPIRWNTCISEPKCIWGRLPGLVWYTGTIAWCIVKQLNRRLYDEL